MRRAGNREVALDAIALAHLAARLKAADTVVRRDIADTLAVEDRVTVWLPGHGVDRPVKVGSVRVDPGPVDAVVTNGQALIDWVEEHYPTEVEEFQPAPVSRVRLAFLDKLLANAKAAGVAHDERTGEVIPGVHVRKGDPRVVVTPAKTEEATLAIGQAVQDADTGVAYRVGIGWGGTL